MTTPATTTTTTGTRKRFSFASFSLFNKSSQPITPSLPIQPEKPTHQDQDANRRRRAQKSQSLYVKSFRNLKQAKESKTEYNPEEAKQANSSEIRSTIRRSLSAILYASPQTTSSTTDGGSKGLVPVLVTETMGDQIMISESAPDMTPTETKTIKPESRVEYDNTLAVVPDRSEESVSIVWQGYAYTVSVDEPWLSSATKAEAVTELEGRFETDVWSAYRGLIHPLLLFDKDHDDRVWNGLSSSELRRYYDNYGSVMLKIRESRMLQQQKHYALLEQQGKAAKDWIIPQTTAAS